MKNILNQSEKRISLKDITKALIEEYESIKIDYTLIQKEIEMMFGEHEEGRNYFEDLRDIIPKEDLNIAIDIDYIIKSFYKTKDQIDNLSIKRISGNLSRELLIDNIDAFFKKIDR